MMKNRRPAALSASILALLFNLACGPQGLPGDGDSGGGGSTPSPVSGGSGGCPEPTGDPGLCHGCLDSSAAWQQQLAGAETSASLDAFDACYEGSPGSLCGDPGDCDDLHPAGAEEWRALVDTACRECPAACEGFCASPYGVLVP